MNIAVLYFSANAMFTQLISYGIAALKNYDPNITVCYINNQTKENDLVLKFNKKPDLIVIFVSYHSYELLRRYSLEVRHKLGDKAMIVLCHNVTTGLAEPLLRTFLHIDACIIGEFETALSELCRLLMNKDDFKKCYGIAYLEEQKFVQNELKPTPPIDLIDYPAREFFATDTRYFDVLGSRGCEGKCTFCDRNYIFNSSITQKPRFREIESVASEIDLLVRQYNCKFVSFNDATFCSTDNIVSRLDELYEALRVKPYWVQFSMCLRCEQITPLVVNCINKLKKVGLGKVYIGIESFNNEDLALYGKRSNVIDNNNAIANLSALELFGDDYHVRMGYGFINFHPYSTMNGLRHNLSELQKQRVNIDPYIVSTKASLNYFTALTQRVDQDNLFKLKISQMSLRELMDRRFAYTFLTEEVELVYSTLCMVKKITKYKNINGSEFIRNRYYHFYGFDHVIQKYDEAYNKRFVMVNSMTHNICEYILNSDDNWIKKNENVEIMSRKFYEVNKTLEKTLQPFQNRITIQLQKIDELIYNKL